MLCDPHDGAALVALLAEPGFSADDEPVEGFCQSAGRFSKPVDRILQGGKDEILLPARPDKIDQNSALVPNLGSSHSNPKKAADVLPLAEE